MSSFFPTWCRLVAHGSPAKRTIRLWLTEYHNWGLDSIWIPKPLGGWNRPGQSKYISHVQFSSSFFRFIYSSSGKVFRRFGGIYTFHLLSRNVFYPQKTRCQKPEEILTPLSPKIFRLIKWLTFETLVISFGEEKHSLSGPLGCLEQPRPVGVLAERREQQAVGSRHIGQEGLSGGRSMVQLQVMVERAFLVTCANIRVFWDDETMRSEYSSYSIISYCTNVSDPTGLLLLLLATDILSSNSSSV